MTVVVKGIRKPYGTTIELEMKDGSPGGGASDQHVEVSIPTAEVLTLNSNPKIIVPTPAADQLVVVKLLVLEFLFGGTAYSGNTRLIFPYLPFTAGSTDAVAGQNGFLAQTANGILVSAGLDSVQAAANFLGKAVGVSVQTGNPVGGNGSMKLSCDYKLVTIPA
jgi:hypothetical protein